MFGTDIHGSQTIYWSDIGDFPSFPIVLPPVFIRKMTIKVYCASSLLQPIYTIIVSQQTLVAVATVMAQGQVKKNKERQSIVRRLLWRGWLRKANPALSHRRLMLIFNVKLKVND